MHPCVIRNILFSYASRHINASRHIHNHDYRLKATSSAVSSKKTCEKVPLPNPASLLHASCSLWRFVRVEFLWACSALQQRLSPSPLPARSLQRGARALRTGSRALNFLLVGRAIPQAATRTPGIRLRTGSPPGWMRDLRRRPVRQRRRVTGQSSTHPTAAPHRLTTSPPA